MFAIGYFVEILILIQNRTYACIIFYVSAYAVDTNIAKQTSVLFILICIIGNFINVLMEEGLFRGLFPRMLIAGDSGRLPVYVLYFLDFGILLDL